MKNIILLLALFLISSCKAQQKTIKSINDAKLIENIIAQFSEKAKIKIDNSVFVLYFQEKPDVTEVHNDNIDKYIYSGLTTTIYRFESQSQINEFRKDYDVYRKSENIFYIFDKKSNPKLLKKLRINKLEQVDIENSYESYDPKSWVLNFNSTGDLEKCYPYNCN
jgi:phage pi2 protein 07